MAGTEVSAATMEPLQGNLYPGYYTNDKTYYLESNIFDAVPSYYGPLEQKRIITNIDKFCKDTKTMIKQLEQDKILKK
jgi:hypothetical protein